MSARALAQIWAPQKILREAAINILECKVCFENYKQQQHLRRPQNLRCGHVICQQCVSSLTDSHNLTLECPFCRQSCRVTETSECLPVLCLVEIFQSSVHIPEENSDKKKYTSASGQEIANVKMSSAFGGWGELFNPTSVAFCPRSRTVVIAHDGRKRVRIFNMRGECILQFGHKGHSRHDINYPLGVSFTLDGYILVADGGDRSIKAFNIEGKNVLVVRKQFCLPWGVAVNSANQMLVTDSEAGTLSLLEANFRTGEVNQNEKVLTNLCHPREVAVSQTDGCIIVVEHLLARASSCGMRLKLFSNKMQLVGQIDSFGISLLLSPELCVSAVSFDWEGNVIVADRINRSVLCISTSSEFPSFKNIIQEGLVNPVGLVSTGEKTLIVLDSGDHSVKLYTAGY
ncbi:E3 ubiquitin-protein ligase NHLRC1 [Protopterus annectens]|uniref:E3 ubiquitin-protein ligase NHLRC1 n=1 Tax=Protopterus annectens TaxID=7888 RepID=UPI001CFB42DF|nr:E3 ubiquitin-protein ligase NHLRC1 [Protopterus annectens]